MADNNQQSQSQQSQQTQNPGTLSNSELAATLVTMAERAPVKQQATLREAAARLGRVTPMAAGSIPLILDGSVRVQRNGKPATIDGGQLVRDTDLTQEEIDELTALRVIRFATYDEIQALGADEPPAAAAKAAPESGTQAAPAE